MKKTQRDCCWLCFPAMTLLTVSNLWLSSATGCITFNPRSALSTHKNGNNTTHHEADGQCLCTIYKLILYIVCYMSWCVRVCVRVCKKQRNTFFFLSGFFKLILCCMAATHSKCPYNRVSKPCWSWYGLHNDIWLSLCGDTELSCLFSSVVST